MQFPIAPASDAIFNAVVYTNGELAAAPRTAGEWARLRAQADALRTAAQRLADLAPADNPGEWRRQADALARASADAARAVDEESLAGVLDAGGNIYSTCTTCHAAYAERAD